MPFLREFGLSGSIDTDEIANRSEVPCTWEEFQVQQFYCGGVTVSAEQMPRLCTRGLAKGIVAVHWYSLTILSSLAPGDVTCCSLFFFFSLFLILLTIQILAGYCATESDDWRASEVLRLLLMQFEVCAFFHL